MEKGLPKRRTDDLIIEHLDDEILVYDLRNDRAHALNPTSSAVWEWCDGTRSEEDIIDLASSLGFGDGEATRDVVRLALGQLDRGGLLEASAALEPSINRRQLIRRLSLAGAVALAVPLVRSIDAPAAAQAASCRPKHGPCSSPQDCCSGICHPSGNCG